MGDEVEEEEMEEKNNLKIMGPDDAGMADIEDKVERLQKSWDDFVPVIDHMLEETKGNVDALGLTAEFADLKKFFEEKHESMDWKESNTKVHSAEMELEQEVQGLIQEAEDSFNVPDRSIQLPNGDLNGILSKCIKLMDLWKDAQYWDELDTKKNALLETTEGQEIKKGLKEMWDTPQGKAMIEEYASLLQMIHLALSFSD